MSADSKLMPLDEAIAKLVPVGCSVVTGTYMEQKIPFAAAHEIIRQQKRDLTLIGPISDILFDQLIGAGCVERVMATWVGNVMMGSAYNFRRAVEEDDPMPLDVVDYTNFTMSLALHAAALGVPFLPTRSTLGSSILKENPHLKVFESPVGDSEKLVAVEALHPDVAIVHACRADDQGNGMVWGNLGITLDAVAASSSVIVIAEEVVPAEMLRRDPNRVLIPGFRVNAVCHVPWSCHPSPAQGYYNRDDAWFREYHKASKRRQGYRAWLKKWVLDVPDWAAYLDKVGPERLKKLKPSSGIHSDPVYTGF